MRGVEGTILPVLGKLRAVRKALEEGRISLDNPSSLAWLSTQLRDVAYHIHMKVLECGDEAKAVQVFEELFIPFDRIAELFRSLQKIQTAHKHLRNRRARKRIIK